MSPLISTLKRVLKTRGVTYADLAERIALSEASVKRLFSQGTFTLERLEQVCAGLRARHPSHTFVAGADNSPVPELAAAELAGQRPAWRGHPAEARMLRGLAELRVKESDRLAVMAEGLAACGVAVAIEGERDDISAGAEGKALRVRHHRFDTSACLSLITLTPFGIS